MQADLLEINLFIVLSATKKNDFSLEFRLMATAFQVEKPYRRNSDLTTNEIVKYVKYFG